MDRRTRFLISRAAGAAMTASALRPPDRFGRAAPLEFVVGVPTSEMPLHVGALQGGLALLGARRGGARGWRGLAGLGLTAASAAGLWRLHRDAQASEQVLEEALVAALGPGLPRRDRRAVHPGAGRAGHPAVACCCPAFARRSRYTLPTGRDLPYGDAGRRNHLDIWRRADLPDDAGAPVLLQVHGGGWVIGQKEGQAHPLMAHLADRGWVCVSINYRLSPRATWPEHIVDVKRALAWTRAHIADHGGDPDFVAITGGSAGGHLAALAALTPGLPAFQPGFEDAGHERRRPPCPSTASTTSPTATATPTAGLERLLATRVLKTRLADDRATWELASPMSHVRPDAPPFFLLHGTNDTLVPVEQGRAFARMLRETSRQPVAFAELPRAQHAFDTLPSVRAYHTVRAVERFLAVVRSQHGGVTPAEAVGADRA